MYLPLIWSLFSKKQTGKTVLATTIISLAITLSFKFLIPALIDFNLSRAGEMILGVSVPAVFVAISEIWLRFIKAEGLEYVKFQQMVGKKIAIENASDSAVESSGENKQGLRMIAIGILATGLIIGVLGIMASNGKIYVLGMSFLLLLIGFRILFKTLK